MPDPELLSASSAPTPSAPPTELLEAQLGLVRGRDLCLHLVAEGHGNLILHHYNLTGRMDGRRPQEDNLGTLKLAFVAASVLIILENLLVLAAIVRKLQTRRWVYSCIASIALSDLLTGVAYVVNLSLSGSRTFRLSPTMWFLREGLLFVALAASTFSLLVTAIERYSAMVRPIAENEASKKARLRGLLCSCWVLAVVMGLLPLVGWNCLCDLPSCSTLLPLYSKSYILFSVLVFVVILLGIVVLYVSIYRQVWRSARQATSRYGRKRSLRLLTTVLIILFAFLFCWIPLFILLLMDIFPETRRWKLHEGLGWVLTLAVVNSFINPIIYSFRSQEVKRAVVDLLCCCHPRAVTDIPSGSSTESSLKAQDSFRNSKSFHLRKAREPLSSNSSAMSTVPPDDKSGWLQGVPGGQESLMYSPEALRGRAGYKCDSTVDWNLDCSERQGKDAQFNLCSNR